MTDELLEIPLIISVDDHVMEPPDLWTARLPSKFGSRIPHLERAKSTISWHDGHYKFERSEDGEWCDWWVFDDYQFPISALFHGAGIKDVANAPSTFDEMRPSVWVQDDRIAAMARDHVDASLQFPNTLPRFAGQAFAERKDKEFALLALRAYNDWLIDEWCAGAGYGRLLPVAVVPFWDAELSAEEIRRVAAKGCHAITFPENPYPLGFPALHSRSWDPVFQACSEMESTLCMHIGSSSKMTSTSPESPFIISSTLTFSNAMGSVLDFIFSGIVDRYPTLKLAFSEGQIGWMPYLFERADKLWAERGNNNFGTDLPRPPSSYIPGRIYGCLFDDEVGLQNRHLVGMDQICYEVDFPHADSPFPHTLQTLTNIVTKAGLSNEEIYKLVRGNAIRAFGLERFGITK
jgi:predicted TIM-barrel fold metal-dependent hydrolase